MNNKLQKVPSKGRSLGQAETLAVHKDLTKLEINVCVLASRIGKMCHENANT